MTTRNGMLPGQEPYTDEERAKLAALVSDAAAGDPGEGAEPIHPNRVSVDASGVTGIDRAVWDLDAARPEPGNPAAKAAHAISERQRGALIDTRRSRELARELRASLDDLEREERQQATEAGEAGRELLELLRALEHRDELEPREERSEHARIGEPFPAMDYRATFGHALVNVRSSSGRWSSKPQPQIVNATGYRHGPNRSEPLDAYTSARGTSDPDKLTEEYEKAKRAARDLAATFTAGAFLIYRGIDPATAPDPSELVAVVCGSRYSGAWGAGVALWSPTWSLALASTGEPLEGGPSIDSASKLAELATDRAKGGHGRTTPEERRALWDAGERHPNTQEGATGYAVEHAEEARRLLLWIA